MLLSRIVHLLSLLPGAADADPATGMTQRLASAPAGQLDALIGNGHLRGFLKAVFRLREEGRLADGEWLEIAQFLMRVRKGAPRSVAHLVAQWPEATRSWATLRELMCLPLPVGSEGAARTIARLQALLAYLRQHAQMPSWHSHGFDVEFQRMADDRAVGTPQRIEVLQLSVQRVGLMNEAQLHECRQRIAAALERLPLASYPCIHDALSRVSNEAGWLLAFAPMASNPSGT